MRKAVLQRYNLKYDKPLGFFEYTIFAQEHKKFQKKYMLRHLLMSHTMKYMKNVFLNLAKQHTVIHMNCSPHEEHEMSLLKSKHPEIFEGHKNKSYNSHRAYKLS